MQISTLLPSERSSHAQKAYLIKQQPFLVDCNGRSLRARPISESDLSSGSNRSMRLDGEIAALALYTVRDKSGGSLKTSEPSHETQGIVALSGHTLYFIELRPAGLCVRSKLPLAIVQGHARPPEGGPCVQVCRVGGTEVLVLYVVAGFLTMVDLGGLSSPKRGNLVHRTFSIGSIAVVRLAVVPVSVSQAAVAVLYRDIDFNYSLRYYGIDSHVDRLPALSQMELFSGTPSHVMPAARGCFVFSDTKLYYFPGLQSTVALSASAAEDPSLSLSQKHHVVTKSLPDHVTGSKVTCACQIDGRRYLYVTDTGSTYMLYADITGSHSQVQVADLQVLDLGKSTIASCLVHVSDNVFYAGSSLSRSIVFQVRPSHPYIHVARTLTNSPPILDITMGLDAYGQDMWISRGGFHNGEVQLYAGGDLGMCQKAEVALGAEATAIRFAQNGCIILFDDGNVTTWLTPALQKTDVSHEDHSLECPSRSCPPIDPRRLFGICDNRKWQIGTQQLALENSTFSYGGVSIDTPATEITDVTWYMQEGMLQVLVGSWGGILSHLDFGRGGSAQTLHTGGTGHTSVCRTSSNMVFSTDGMGAIYQSRGFGGETRHVPSSAMEAGFKLVGGGEDPVLVCSTHSVYILESSGFSEPKRVYHTQRRIRSCDVQGTRVAVLFHDDSVATFEVERLGPNHNVYLSDKLILKTVVLGKWVVALQMEMTPPGATSTHTRTPRRGMTLLVLDSRTLQEESREVVGGGLVDVCVVHTAGIPLLVGAFSGCRGEDTLAVYRVEKGRIRQVSVPINGLLPSMPTIAKMTSYGNHVYLAGSTALHFILKGDVHSEAGGGRKTAPTTLGLFWHAQVVESQAGPFFFVDLAASAQGLVLADTNRGIFFRKKSGAIQKIPLDHMPVYATAVAMLEDSPAIIYGDSVGNLGIVSGDTHETCFDRTLLAATIHEQINTITVAHENPLRLLVGTVQGSVYCVQEAKGDQVVHKDHAEMDMQWLGLQDA